MSLLVCSESGYSMGEFELLNLDCMTRCELFDVYTRMHDAARKPENRDVRDAMLRYAHYADQKREAIRLRLDGQIAAAMKIETRCDRIYATMPEFARW